MKKPLLVLAAVLVLCSMAVPAFATAEGPGVPPNPSCTWVEATTHVVHHDAETRVVHHDAVIVHHDAETHEEQVVDYRDCPTVTFSASHEVVDVAGHYIYADKITVIDVPGHMADNYVCPASQSAYISTNHKECKWPVKINGDWKYADKVNIPIWVPATYAQVCPVGYESHGQDCRKWVDPTYTTETFSVTFKYEKSNDPNKCHKPTPETLGIPTWARDDYGKNVPEWLDSVPVYKTVIVTDVEAYDETVSAAYDETVTDAEAWDETITDVAGHWDCPEMCKYNPDIPAADPKCKEPEECKWVKTHFGIIELEMADGRIEPTYIYADADGKLPKGVGVERQLCIYGEIAVKSHDKDFVYRNTCTGAFMFDGMVWYPRADVVKDGVCARNGACITK